MSSCKLHSFNQQLTLVLLESESSGISVVTVPFRLLLSTRCDGRGVHLSLSHNLIRIQICDMQRGVQLEIQVCHASAASQPPAKIRNYDSF